MERREQPFPNSKVLRLEQLEKDVGTIRRQLEGERAKSKDLKRRLTQMTLRRDQLVLELDSQIERAERFKHAYNSVKNHRIIRLARAVIIPLKNLSEISNNCIRKARKRASVLLDPDQDTFERKDDNSVSQGKELGSELPSSSSDPRAEVREIGILYRQNGNIKKAKELIDSLSPDFELSDAEKELFEQVRGMARLIDQLPAIPPRQSNPGYAVNRSLVMYCAHSTGEFNSNGYSARTTGLTQALSEEGMEVLIAARPGYPWDVKTDRKPHTDLRFESDKTGVSVVYNPGPSWSKQPLDLFIIEATDAYVREATIHRPSVIVAASNHVTALPALIAARRLGIPFAYEVRGLWEITEASGKPGWATSGRFNVSLALESLVATEADHVFAITEEVSAELQKRGVDKKRISLLPNASDIYKFAPIPAENDFVSKHGKGTGFVVGYAGSIVGYEGLDTLIESVKKLRDKNLDVICTIVGDGPELNNLKSQVNLMGLKSFFEFTGRVPAEEIPNYISSFDAVVCPRHSNEVTEMVSPLKPLEAMAAGKPVIGSDVAPILALLGEDGSRGLTFKAGNPESLSTAIEQLVNSPKTAEDIGRRARRWIVSERSWKVVARSMKTHLKDLKKREVQSDSAQISDLTIAIISDDFTFSSLKFDLNLIRPTPSNWREQLDKNKVHALLVESAWEGNDGKWKNKVGYYEETKCADLRKLINYCRTNGIPTIFWNKEDPVHFNRFRRTAKYFDHVFTTDAACINAYWTHRGPFVQTIASLPFWAQPVLHNPLPSRREYEHSVAYGGSYYGDRYAKRSAELLEIVNLLDVSDLAIYDRQFGNPQSPYQFPEKLKPAVRGGLPYLEMVDAYKAHPIHINVNSVSDSPTMFSRRVFELAASGTPIISGPSKGMMQIFGKAIKTVESAESLQTDIQTLLTEERQRNELAWTLLRTVYRSHLAGHRLAYVLRSAGLKVDAPELKSYQIELPRLSDVATQSVLAQTHLPSYVVSMDDSSENARKISEQGIQIAKEPVDLPMLEIGLPSWDAFLAEDLMTAFMYSGRSVVRLSDEDLEQRGRGLWCPSSVPKHSAAILSGRRGPHTDFLDVRRSSQTEIDDAEAESEILSQTVLVAGHDLKFAGRITQQLEARGHQVIFDKWKGHTIHDEATSRELLRKADVVFCEWSLGNVAWYAKNKLPGQRLVSRFHLQELFTPYLKNTQLNNIDHTIFVGEFTRQAAIRRFGYDPQKTSVVSNTVDLERLDKQKSTDARFTLGLVGIVPQRKRLDLALDVLENLRKIDRRYRLLIKGHRPEEYPWMAKRTDEMQYYEDQYDRIDKSEHLKGAVDFCGHGNDMDEWYQQVGVVLSVSDFESFHYSLADGAASSALPVSISWAGAEEIYPSSWIFSTTEEMASYILKETQDPLVFQNATMSARKFAEAFFASETVDNELVETIIGSSTSRL